jgi:RNA recognition motif-containing protein
MTTIFVGNLSFQTSEAELLRAFSHYGRVTSVRMMTDRTSGSPRGFAFVQMPGMDDAEEAIARMNGQSIAGRSITVNEARSRAESKSPGYGAGSPPVAARRSALLDAL